MVDNADAAASLARVLSMLGNEVKTARDGVEAVELASSFAPDVVLMGVAMPRMNGDEATLDRLQAERHGTHGG